MTPTLESCTCGEGTLGTKVTNYIGWVLDRPEHISKAAFYYLNCQYTMKDAGELAHLSRTGVEHMLEREGLPSRPRGLPIGYTRDKDLQQLCVMLYEDQKLGCPEIGEMLGLHKTAVKWRLVRAGVKMRSRKEATKLRMAKIPKKQLSERARKSYANTDPEVHRQRIENAVAARRRKLEEKAA